MPDSTINATTASSLHSNDFNIVESGDHLLLLDSTEFEQSQQEITQKIAAFTGLKVATVSNYVDKISEMVSLDQSIKSIVVENGIDDVVFIPVQSHVIKSDSLISSDATQHIISDEQQFQTVNRPNYFRKSDGSPTRKLIGQAFSIDDKDLKHANPQSGVGEDTRLRSAKSDETFREMRGFLSAYADQLSDQGSEKTDLFRSFAATVTKAAQWELTPKRALKQVVETLCPDGQQVKSGARAAFSVLTAGSYKGGMAGHAMLCEIIGEEDGTCTLRYHNTGGGIANNHPQVVDEQRGGERYSPGEPRRYQTTMTYKNIPIDNVENIVEKLQSFKPQSEQDVFSRIDDIYAYLRVVGDEQPQGPVKGYDKPQSMGNCAWKSLQHMIKHSLSYEDYLDFKLFVRESILDSVTSTFDTAEKSATVEISTELFELAKVKLDKTRRKLEAIRAEHNT